MCVNDLTKVALDSAVVGTQPAISSRKSHTSMPPSHTSHTGRPVCLKKIRNVGQKH